jgi:MFS family permease
LFFSGWGLLIPGDVSEYRNYLAITGAYWAFTLTDGALRMLVLLYLHEEGYTPVGIASLFLFYEFFGIVTNLVGGWLGARFGLKSTLFSGLLLQVGALSILAWQADALSMPLVMLVQAASGIAKDLTKMSSKSYLKFVIGANQPSRLLKWVAILTGSKNTLKGVGFFLGGLLLTTVGFAVACQAMAIVLAAVLLLVGLLLPRLGNSNKSAKFTALWSRSTDVNWLSAARLFLFGSRDIWFVLGLPIFLSAQAGWSHTEVGASLAVWVIGYGLVQAIAPAFIKPSQRLWPWTAALILPLAGILFAIQLHLPALATIIVGLAAFGFVFACNSALHSYLILEFSEDEQVAMNVGYYYMANAAGRLVGTILSGILYQMAGLEACLAGSLVFVAMSAGLSTRVRRPIAIGD